VKTARHVLVAALLAVALVLSAAPAQAGVVRAAPGYVCIERGHAAEGRGIARDFVRAGRRDEHGRWVDNHPVAAAQARAGLTVTVPVHFHVIRKDNTADGGNVTRDQIRQQIRVLNRSFSGATGGVDTGLRFELIDITRTTSTQWFRPSSFSKERAMKKALKVGGPETLNIYSANLGNSLLGWAYLAQDAEEVGVLDGVVVHFQSLPGGDWGDYSLGDTGTHEVGHWIDLLHTFEGGCTGPGDQVDDTAPEASPAYDCPEGRNTCAGGGPDPITNFMDYTLDSCMFEFTAGQGERMREAWVAYRAG
jgi:Pregnancy-associated plasma protein-A